MGLDRVNLDALVGKGMTSWPSPQVTGLAGLSQDVNVAVMTYASDMFSWRQGSVDADVYFCPERHGTYYGSFYLKDAPAMGNPDYNISPTLTGDAGDALLAALTPTQAAIVTGLVTSQNSALTEIVARRTDLANQLRLYLSGKPPNSITVMSLVKRYGVLDGQISYLYATAFAKVGAALTPDQVTRLAALRAKICSLTPSGGFRYSRPVAMPAIPSTDFLFGTN